MPDNSRSAVWFLNQVLNGRFSQLSKKNKYDISHCCNVFVPPSKPLQCPSCLKFFHKTNRLKPHTCFSNANHANLDLHRVAPRSGPIAKRALRASTTSTSFLNAIIQDVNNSSIEEINTVFVLLLHKGNNKPKTDHQSYRTISTCPILSKALDTYIRDLNIEKWNRAQADTQYQGAGSSHELASLLITETIQH